MPVSYQLSDVGEAVFHEQVAGVVTTLPSTLQYPEPMAGDEVIVIMSFFHSCKTLITLHLLLG